MCALHPQQNVFFFMDWIRDALGMGGAGGGDKPPPPKRDPHDDRSVGEKSAALERALRAQIGALEDELEEVTEEFQAAMKKRDQRTAKVKLLRKKAIENELRQKNGLMANVNTTKKGVHSAAANQQQGLLMREAADEIQTLNAQTEQLDLEGAMDDLKEGIADTMDFSDQLSEPILGEGELAASMGMGAESLDEEMERLMREQEEMEAVEALSQVLPVPITTGGSRHGTQQGTGTTSNNKNKSTGN